MKEYVYKNKDQKYYIRYNDLPGEKTPILFIPGWGCASSFDFVELASQEGLSQHRRILVDLLGAGYSDRPEDFDYLPSSHSRYLLELVKELKLDSLIIYAHSMGGRIALDLQEKLGDLSLGLILSEGSMVEEFFPYMDQGEETFRDVFYPKMLKNLARHKDQQFLGTVRNASPLALYREAREMMDPASPKWEEMFFKADYKKVFIFGEDTDDDGFNLENIRAEDQIHLIELKGAKHTMNWDLPKETAAAIVEGIKYINK